MDQVDAIVGAWAGDLPTADIVNALHDAGVPCAPVKSLKDVMTDPQVTDRGLLEHHTSPERDWWTLGTPLRLADSPPPARNVPPALGEHSKQILAGRLALGEEEIDALAAAGVIVSSGQSAARVPAGNGRSSLAYADTADI